MNCELRQGMSGAALAAIVAVTVICAGSLFAVSNEMTAGSTTVTATYTTTLFRTSSGHTSTVLVPTTVTETSPPTLTIPSTATSTIFQTSTNTTTETETVFQTSTNTTTETETSVQTVTQTVDSTTTGNTSSPETFQFAVIYSVANETACQPDPYTQCTWSGTVSWPTSECDFAYACQSLQLGPQPYNGAYPFILGECGIAVNWSLSMNTPSNESQLSVTITNAQGVVVYHSGTSPTTASLGGSYSPC